MAEYIVQGESLTAIADAIRSKTNTSSMLSLDEMPSKIVGIETGGSTVTYKTSVFSEFSKTDSVITETSTLEDGTICVSYISLDANGNPVLVSGGNNAMSIDINYDDSGHATSIIIDGMNHPVTWEGFE